VLGESDLTPRLRDWWEELLWPRVLSGARYGLRPGRMGLAFFFLVLATFLIGIGTALDHRWRGDVVWPWLAAGHRGYWSTLWMWFVETPRAWVWARPITTIIVGPVVLSAGAVAFGAISRMAASEISTDDSLPWTAGLAFALARWKSLIGAVLGPLVLAWLLTGFLAVGGILSRWPVTNVLFAILYGLALLLAFLTTMVLVIFVLGYWMLIPAVVCEGTDAIDAIQRTYRYVLARPVRLVAYLALGAIGWAIIVGVVWLIAALTIGLAAHATGQWGDSGRSMIWAATLEAGQSLNFAGTEPKPQGTFAAGAAIVRLWVLIPVLLVFAAVVSCGLAMSTMVYLAMRRVCDGQDVAELWSPGMIPGTMAMTMESRAMAAAASGAVPAGAASIQEADDQ
jgi:hypothetical protein